MQLSPARMQGHYSTVAVHRTKSIAALAYSFRSGGAEKNGTEYSPETLHHLCCGIMRFLCWNGWPSIDFFANAEFMNFRAILDGEMKRLQAQEVGSKRKQAEPLTEQEE